MEGKREKNNLSLSFIYKYLPNLTVMIMALFFLKPVNCIICPQMYLGNRWKFHM